MAAWAVTPLIVSHQVSTGAKLWCGVFVTDRNNDVLALSQKKRRHTVCSLSKVPRVLRKTIKQKLNIPQCLSVTCTYVFFSLYSRKLDPSWCTNFDLGSGGQLSNSVLSLSSALCNFRHNTGFELCVWMERLNETKLYSQTVRCPMQTR